MKTNLLKTFFAALLLLCSSVASAHDFEADGIFYNITDATAKTVEVTYKGDSYSEYNEYSGSVIIPSMVTYNNIVYSITGIAERAFYNCEGLTSIVISFDITSIGEKAFYNCSNLKQVINFSSLNIVKGSESNGYVGYYSNEIKNFNDDFKCVYYNYTFKKKDGEI